MDVIPEVIRPAPLRQLAAAVGLTAVLAAAAPAAEPLAGGRAQSPAESGTESAEQRAERVEIVARSIEHHGGDLYRASETALELCSGTGCYRLRVRTDGGRYRHEVSGPYRGSQRTVIADNDSVTVRRDGEPVALIPEARQALRDWATARVYFAYLPFRLEDPAVLHEDLGIEEWEGRRLHKVKVTFVAGSSTDAHDEYLYWFDPACARLEQFAYSFRGRPGGLRFRRLENYRRVGGILFFDQTNLGVEGDGLQVEQIDPAFVHERMREISRVELRDISVRPLGDATGRPPAGP